MNTHEFIKKINNFIAEHHQSDQDGRAFRRFILKQANIAISKRLPYNGYFNEEENRTYSNFILLNFALDNPEQEKQLFNFLSKHCGEGIVERDVRVVVPGVKYSLSPFYEEARYVIKVDAVDKAFFQSFKDDYIKEIEQSAQNQVSLIRKLSMFAVPLLATGALAYVAFQNKS